MYVRVKKEKYGYPLIVAILLHIVLFSAFFLSLRQSSKLLFLAPPPLQVIHATAISMDALEQKSVPVAEKIKPPPPAAAQTLSKPVLLEKSPVLLPVKVKKVHKAEQDKIIPLKTASKQPSLEKKVVPVKSTSTKVVTTKTKKFTKNL